MSIDIYKKRCVGLARMMYEQGRYNEAEKIIKDNLVNAESKYLMGKLCIQKGERDEAKIWFYRAIDNDRKWISPRLELARIWTEEGIIDKAESEYQVCINRSPQDVELKLEYAIFCIEHGNTEKAKQLITKAIRLKPNNERTLMRALEVNDKMQNYEQMYEISEKLLELNAVKPTDYKTIETMARTYFSLGKYDKVVRTFRGKTQEPTNRIMENLYKRRIYSILNKDEKQAKMYQSLMANIEEAYGEEEILKHVEKHMNDDKYKEIHGVFTKPLPEILDKVKAAEKIKQKGHACDIYCIKLDNCGYQGGNKGDGHTLNYITLITMPGSQKPITMFPSDKIMINNLELVKKENRSEEWER